MDVRSCPVVLVSLLRYGGAGKRGREVRAALIGLWFMGIGNSGIFDGTCGKSRVSMPGSWS